MIFIIFVVIIYLTVITLAVREAIIHPDIPRICPFCGSEVGVVIYRWADVEFQYDVRCPKCGVIKNDFALSMYEVVELEKQCKKRGIKCANLIRQEDNND